MVRVFSLTVSLSIIFRNILLITLLQTQIFTFNIYNVRLTSKRIDTISITTAITLYPMLSRIKSDTGIPSDAVYIKINANEYGF